MFSWAQYVKQVAYLECRLAQGFKSYAVVCDCEKKAVTEMPASEKDPLSRAHAHIHPDDLFPHTKIILGDFSLLCLLQTKWLVGSEEIFSGWCAGILKPPQEFQL